MAVSTRKGSYSARCETMIKKFGGSVPNGDIWSAGLLCSDNVEQLAQLTAIEKLKFFTGGERKRFGYSHKLLKLRGNIDIKQFFSNYEKLSEEQPLLRTQYIFDSVSAPLRVLNAPSPAAFPVLDFCNMDAEQQSYAAQNAFAAELHREYDPQIDSVMRLRGFITGEKSMSLIISICAATGFSLTAQEAVKIIFGGMEILTDNAVPVSPAESRTDKNAAARLREFLGNIPAGQSLPGYISDQEQSAECCTEYKALDWELSEQMRGFCYEHKIGTKELFLTAWAELQGRFNSSDEVALVLHGAENDVYPIKVNRALRVADCAADISGQEKCAISSDFSDLCESAGLKKGDFLTEHRFIDFTGGSPAGSSSCAAGLILSISYILQKNKSGIIYCYRSGSFYSSVVERIHKLFVSIIEELMSPEQKRVDLWKILKISDKDGSQLKKAQIARKAVALSESGLFPDCSPEELTKLAERARLQEYTLDAEIFSERRMTSEIALAADGKIEESRIGASGKVKSVSLLKKGDIFCVRALLDDNVSMFTYTAASENASVLWIKREDFMSFAGMSPKIWLAVIEHINDGGEKMKRLWTII